MSNQFTTRREFLQNGALAGTGLAAGHSLLAQRGRTPELGARMKVPINLGLCSYTFRNFSRAQLIDYMQQLNMNELNAKDAKDHLPHDPKEEAKAVAHYAEAQINLHAAGAIYFTKGTEDDVREQFDYCRRAGVKVMVGGDPTPETLPMIEKYAKQYDIKVAIHNHGPEDKLWPSPLDVLKDIKGLDPRIGCCIDVGHTVRTGTDVVQAVREVGPRLLNMHMKDLTDFTKKESQVAVGDGKMPVRQIFEALRAIEYKGFVDLEYEVMPDNPLPGVQKSFAYMRQVIEQMG